MLSSAGLSQLVQLQRLVTAYFIVRATSGAQFVLRDVMSVCYSRMSGERVLSVLVLTPLVNI